MPMINNAEQEEWLVQTLKGIKSVLEEQGAVLLGGHSMETRSEPPTPTSLGIEIAMTINGATTKPWRKSGIKPGDKLLLSRPLGTGILFAGAMRGATSPKHMDDAINEMNKNQKGLVDETRMLAATVNACTDITGFGLLGHLGEMISDQPNISIELNERAIPRYEGVMELLSQGVKSTLSPANQASWKWLDKRIKIDGEVSAGMLELLVDPQTCGPILIACDENTAKRLEDTKKWKIIGEAKGDNDRSEQYY